MWIYLLFDTIIVTSALSGTGLLSPNIAYTINLMFILIYYLYLSLMNIIKIPYTDIFFFIVNIMLVGITFRFNLIFVSLLLCLYRIIRVQSNRNCAKTLNHYYFTSLIIFCFIFIANTFLGFNKNNTMIMWRGDTFIFRESLGFLQPNIAMLFFLVIYISGLSYFFIREKLRIGIVLNFSLLFFVYSLTQSRTTFYACSFISILFFLFKKMTYKKTRIVRLVAIKIPILFLGLSVFFMISPINEELNRLLSGRLVLYKTFYQQSGIKMLGTKSLEYEMFDNSFLHMLLSKGIVYSSLMLLIMRKIISRNHVSNFAYGLYILLMLCGMTETLFSKIELWIPVMLLFQIESEGVLNEKELSD